MRKIHAESFVGHEHLVRIQEEAKAIVAVAPGHDCEYEMPD